MVWKTIWRNNIKEKVYTPWACDIRCVLTGYEIILNYPKWQGNIVSTLLIFRSTDRISDNCSNMKCNRRVLNVIMDISVWFTIHDPRFTLNYFKWPGNIVPINILSNGENFRPTVIICECYWLHGNVTVDPSLNYSSGEVSLDLRPLRPRRRLWRHFWMWRRVV
jgi:hypothetical protein